MPYVFFIRTAIILGLWLTLAALPQTATPFLPQAIANAEEFEEEESEDNISESDIQVQHLKFPIQLLGSQHTMAGVLYVNPSPDFSQPHPYSGFLTKCRT